MKRLALIALLVAAPASPPASADETGALVGRAMDAPVTLTLDEVPLDKAISAITDATGVPLRIRPGTYDLLPYGRFTPVTLDAQGASLRATLAALAEPLGLALAGGESGGVELEPLAVLERGGRRATAQELRLARLLRTTPLPGNSEATQLTLEDLMEVVDLHLLALDNARPDGSDPHNFHVELRVSDDPSRRQDVQVARGRTLLDALEAAAAQTDASFTLWGDAVVIRGDRALVEDKLDRPVTVRYDGSPIAQVLVDLAERSGVPFAIEPGALAGLPPEARTLRLRLDHASVRQALDAIAGYTGLAYDVTGRDVRIRLPGSDLGGGVLALEEVDGVLVPVRESDVSPAVAEALRRRRDEAARRVTERVSE